MSMLFEGLEALAQGMRAAGELHEQARQAFLVTVRQDMAEFPPVLLDDDGLPTHRTGLRSRVRLFPLGDYRYVWLEPMRGRTTLYMGSDGRLYEYGPQFIRSSDLDSPVADNPMSLRSVLPEKLTFAELQQCRDLLRGIWI